MLINAVAHHPSTAICSLCLKKKKKEQEKSFKKRLKQGMMEHAFNPNSLEAEAGEFLSSREALST